MRGRLINNCGECRGWPSCDAGCEKVTNTRLAMPEPAPKFVKENDIVTQLLHITQELGEASTEVEEYHKAPPSQYKYDRRVRAAEELADVVFSSFTALAILGFGENERAELFARTITKNKERGYYKT